VRIFVLLFFFAVSCAPRPHTISQAQVEQDTTSIAHEPMPLLHAYRKKPGEAKTVQVEGYHRKDSTYVDAHTRTARSKKITQ
jgi:hypothetical protein